MNLNQSLSRAAMLLAVMATVQILLQLPNLPSPMASRFSWAGKAVGWTSPTTFATINLVFIASIIAITILLPALMGKRPRLRWWRLPNRDYWLAPENLPKTVEYVQRQLAWFGVMTLLLLMAVFQLVVEANRHDPPALDNTRMLIFIVAYIVFMLLWAFVFHRKFSRQPLDKRDNPFG
jgi:uncharacterized membrane protein